MEKSDRPAHLYHGTPHAIHASEYPFLDPRYTAGRDECDPTEPHIFTTPDLLKASIFALKDRDCKSIFMTDEGPVIVFKTSPPRPDVVGFVYEVPTEGFEQTLRRGKPSGAWAVIEKDMPIIQTTDGTEQRGIAVNSPLATITIKELVSDHHLRVLVLTGAVDIDTYSAAFRDSLAEGCTTIFTQEAIDRGWLADMTHLYT